MPAVFAVLAALCFGAGLLNIHLGSVSWLYLGLLFVAVHLAIAVLVPWWRDRPRA